MNRKTLIGAAIAVFISACSPGGGGPYTPPGPSASPNAPIGWPVRTAEYVDVWLHGYALIAPDTSRVPLFERGYRARMQEVRRQRNVTTALDANMQTLAAGFTRNPGLTGGQFAIFAFSSFDEMVRVTQLFIRNDGSPSTVNDQTTQQLFVWLRNYFPTVADREWLRVFVMSLQEEQSKFYQSYWNATYSDRAATRTRVNDLWIGTYRVKFERFLRNQRLVDGTFIISMPLGGEGRTVTDPGLGNGIAVPFPATADSAINSIYVFAHEAVASLTQHALVDNVTPMDQRNGVVDKLLPIATVRAGAMLLQKIAPELVAGYEKYYLQHIGLTAPAGDPNATFVNAFTIPDAPRDGIQRSIDLILAGI
jgi:hypothetical protein